MQIGEKHYKVVFWFLIYLIYIFCIYSCFHEPSEHLETYRRYIDMLNKLCPEKDLTNEDRLWFLNICFAEYYVYKDKEIKKNMLEEMRLASYQLAKLGECSFHFSIYH